jgi:predicted component of type VI protein secretion system
MNRDARVSHRLLVKDRRGERELLLIDSIVVGRDPRCDVSEPDAQLSRRHAEFTLSERGVVVRDLNSRNGMLVNGRRILEAVLHPGDVVQVASLAVTFLRAAEPEAVSMPPAVPLRPAPKSRREVDGQPVLPFRPLPEEDDRTGLMSPDQVAAAAIASLSNRASREGAERDPEAPAETDAGLSTVAGGTWPPEPEAAESSSTASTTAGPADPPPAPLPAPSAVATPMPPPVASPVPPPVPVAASMPAMTESAPLPAQTAPAQPPPGQPSASARPSPPPPGPSLAAAPLDAKAPEPITGVARRAWAAKVTWQVATLAVVGFMAGAVSVLPATARGVGVAGVALVLLAPLAGLAVAVGLGLAVAASVRRTVNEVVERARRP